MITSSTASISHHSPYLSRVTVIPVDNAENEHANQSDSAGNDLFQRSEGRRHKRRPYDEKQVLAKEKLREDAAGLLDQYPDLNFNRISKYISPKYTPAALRAVAHQIVACGLLFKPDIAQELKKQQQLEAEISDIHAKKMDKLGSSPLSQAFVLPETESQE